MTHDMTSYYQCTKCGEACNVWRSPRQWNNPHRMQSTCCQAPVRVVTAKEG